VSVELEGEQTDVTVDLRGPDNEILHSSSVTGDAIIQVHQPKLWFPIVYGQQPLYTVTVTTGPIMKSHKVGIRRLRLVQQPVLDQPGTSFYFEINNVPVYCRGSNWVPGDTFLPRLNPQRYREWLELAVEGNQNMIRVWGGGLYEDDSFYEACDELGILIWHDFMLGCGAYPVNEFMMKTIREEAVYNLKRLRNHPSIVLWCGNNEDHMFAELHHLEYDMQDNNPGNWLKSNWPARYYYDKLLPDLCADLVPTVPYHNSSPWGGSYSNDQTVGDVHAWRVWMADQPRFPYQDYGKLAGRFVSEFGMKSYPSVLSIQQLITNESERHPQSRTFDLWHCAPEDQRTLAMYLIDNLRVGFTLEEYVYATQLNQSEAMDYALRAFRRLWKGPGKEECGGSLIWQLNDCFPSVSWSLADSFLRPKMAYYSSKRNYAPIIVGCERLFDTIPQSEFTQVYIDKKTIADVWASNCTLDTIEVDLIIAFHSVSEGKRLSQTTTRKSLAPNQSMDLARVEYEKPWGPQENVICSVKLERDGKVIARHINFPQPLRHLDLSDAEVLLSTRPENENTVVVSVSVRNGVAKGVFLEITDPTIHDQFIFDDNTLDLVPGEVQEVRVRARRGSQVDLAKLEIQETHYGQRMK
jgi:beta-mannosidase